MLPPLALPPSSAISSVNTGCNLRSLHNHQARFISDDSAPLFILHSKVQRLVVTLSRRRLTFPGVIARLLTRPRKALVDFDDLQQHFSGSSPLLESAIVVSPPTHVPTIRDLQDNLANLHHAIQILFAVIWKASSTGGGITGCKQGQ